MAPQFVIAFVLLLTLWRFGWESLADSFGSPQDPRVVYGEDDRRDFYEEEDPRWRHLARSTVALFDEGDLIWSEKDNRYHIDANQYGPSYHLCEDQPFYYQPAKAFCSGFLVDKDVVVTAGHCLRNSFNCEKVRFVFDFSIRNPDISPLVVSEENVYGCKELLQQMSKGTSGEDYAIVLLDRPVTHFEPLRLREEGVIEEGALLTVIGYPKGLPGKMAHGGRLRNNDNEVYFVADLDTFGGNSGSAVFNSETKEVEGILVRGEKDFVYDQQMKCRRSYNCDMGACRGEDVVRISEIVRFFENNDYFSQNSQ